MLKINRNGYEIRVKFYHYLRTDPIFEDPENGDIGPGTDCYIQVIAVRENAEVGLSFGETHLHANDQYNRKFGRKLALARAIQKLIPRKYVNIRRLIWDAYFDMIGEHYK